MSDVNVARQPAKTDTSVAYLPDFECAYLQHEAD